MRKDCDAVRTFVAIELPVEVKQALEALSGRLRRSGAKATWVRVDNIHLTLRFLGDVSECDVNRLGERLALAYQEEEPFVLTVAGTGAFPNSRKPSVIWAGVSPLDGGLARAQTIAEDAAAAIGLDAEARAFRPHLTVARIRDSRAIGELPAHLEQERDFFGGEFRVTAVSLFSSQLTPKGPIYRCLREFGL